MSTYLVSYLCGSRRERLLVVGPAGGVFPAFTFEVEMDVRRSIAVEVGPAATEGRTPLCNGWSVL